MSDCYADTLTEIESSDKDLWVHFSQKVKSFFGMRNTGSAQRLEADALLAGNTPGKTNPANTNTSANTHTHAASGAGGGGAKGASSTALAVDDDDDESDGEGEGKGEVGQAA